MKLLFKSVAVALASIALLTTSVTGQATPTDETDGQPTVNPAADLPTMRTPKLLGCYKSSGGMVDMGYYTFQAMGWCQPLCIHQGKPYLGFVNGTNCFCGDQPPPAGDVVDPSNCQAPCKGFPDDTCGGTNNFAVYDDGYKQGDPTGTAQITVPTPIIAAITDGSKPTTSTQMAVITSLVTQSGGQTVQTVIEVTQTAQPSESNSGPNKVAIAVGITVAVVVVAAVIGGLFFFMRHRKNTAIENERRRHEMMTNLVAGGEKPGSSYSMPDSRLDQGFMFQRRQSDGSIADNEDYSRKILKVTNPDHR